MIRATGLTRRFGDFLAVDGISFEIPRGEISGILGVSDRHARRTVSELLAAGAIGAESARSPLRLAFPAALAGRWFPGLFPNL